jgi:electron transport complex protein RnfA
MKFKHVNDRYGIYSSDHAAVLVNNVVLVQFLGSAHSWEYPGKIEYICRNGLAVVFVMSLANLVTYLIQNYILIPLNIEFMRTITFILVIAFLVLVVENNS